MHAGRIQVRVTVRQCIYKFNDLYIPIPPTSSQELSMGMSADYENAIREGSTPTKFEGVPPTQIIKLLCMGWHGSASRSLVDAIILTQTYLATLVCPRYRNLVRRYNLVYIFQALRRPQQLSQGTSVRVGSSIFGARHYPPK